MIKIISKIKWIVYKISHPFFRLYWKVFKPKTYGSKALLVFKDKILLVRNINVNYWSLPGGKIDNGEKEIDCVIRELKEELNLDIKNVDYLLGTYLSNREGKKDTVYVFVVTLDSLMFQKQWELEDARWFSISELPDNISPAALRRISEFKSGAKDLSTQW